MSNKKLPFLLLSIQSIHSERIFSGAKEYELRKVLPKEHFDRVFLYESGGGRIIGVFEAGQPFQLPVGELWDAVGERATPHDRFFRYFSKVKSGWAIPIRNAKRFSIPLDTSKLQSFRPPMSHRVVRPGTELFRQLQRKMHAETRVLTVKLTPISARDRSLYVQLVTAEIAPKYDDITEEFARSNLRTHQMGADPNGILTTGKEVYAIKRLDGLRIGFTTLTYKAGGCVKTGPTVIITAHRSKGYGLATRRAILRLAEQKSIRKLYCTCPDNDQNILPHLLSAGFTIEAHLRNQYSTGHGEVVLGRMLTKTAVFEKLLICRKDRTRPRLLKQVTVDAAFRFLKHGFMDFWGLTNDSLGEAIVRNALKPKLTYEEKPTEFLAFGSSRLILAAAVLVPKRGGALKVLWFPKAAERWFPQMIDEIEARARSIFRRKIYFIHPSEDLHAIRCLRENGYEIEGLLREPYGPGRDAVVISKFLQAGHVGPN